jgi:hypothetical protein
VRKSDSYRELENKFRKLAETSPQDRSKYLSVAAGWHSLADTSDFVAAQKCEIQKNRCDCASDTEHEILGIMGV